LCKFGLKELQRKFFSKLKTVLFKPVTKINIFKKHD